MNKEKLLSLLDDADVRKKVLAIVNQQSEDVQTTYDEPQLLEELQQYHCHDCYPD